MEYAKSLGDLSENAEYHQAREEQGKLEEKIKTLKHYLGDHPLAIASGVSVDNVHLYAEYVDYLMVASSITDQNEMINKDKLYQLYERIM